MLVSGVGAVWVEVAKAICTPGRRSQICEVRPRVRLITHGRAGFVVIDCLQGGTDMRAKAALKTPSDEIPFGAGPAIAYCVSNPTSTNTLLPFPATVPMLSW
jgi:hypothetical protein